MPSFAVILVLAPPISERIQSPLFGKNNFITIRYWLLIAQISCLAKYLADLSAVRPVQMLQEATINLTS